MTGLGLVVVGLMLGAIAAAGHLLVTRARAHLVVEGRPGVALATMPLSLAVPALCVLAAAAASPVAAWSVLPGLVVTRLLILRRART